MDGLKKMRITEIVTLGESCAQILPNLLGSVEIGDALADLSRDGFGNPLDDHRIATHPVTIERIIDFQGRDGTIDESIFVFTY
jgi:hypothetical protein